VNRNLSVSVSNVGVTTETLYNPGGVLPEVSGGSWVLFLSILAGLVLLLVVPILVSGVGGLFGKSKGKGRIKLANSSPAGTSAKKANIKIK
jgi:hypothetical protein